MAQDGPGERCDCQVCENRNGEAGTNNVQSVTAKGVHLKIVTLSFVNETAGLPITISQRAP